MNIAAGVMQLPGQSRPSSFFSKKTIATLLMITTTISSCGFNLLNLGAMKPTFIKEALSSLIQDRIEYPLSKRFIHFFSNPGRYLEDVKLDKFETKLRNKGYSISRAADGRLTQLTIPLDESVAMDRRLVTFVESGKLNSIMERYPDVVQYRSIESFGVRQTQLEIDFDRLPRNWGSLLGSVHPDFAEFMNLAGRGMIEKSAPMGKFLAYFKTLPRARFFHRGGSYSDSVEANRINAEITDGGSSLGRVKQRVRSYAAASILQTKAFATTNVKKAALKLTPRFLMTLFSPESAAELVVNGKKIDTPIDEALVGISRRAGISRLTRELLEPVAKKISRVATRVLSNKLVTQIATKVAATVGSVAVPGIGHLALIGGLIIGGVCVVGPMYDAITSMIANAQYIAHQQTMIGYMLAYTANVTQLNTEGGEAGFAEMLQAMVENDHESVLGESVLGSGGSAASGSAKEASVASYIPRHPAIMAASASTSLIAFLVGTMLGQEQTAAAINTEMENFTSEGPGSQLVAIQEPFCNVVGWADDIISFITSPIAGAAEYVVGEGLSLAISYFMPFMANTLTQYYVDNLQQSIKFEDSVDALIIGSLESGNTFFQNSLTIQQPLTRTEARNVYIAQYLEREAAGLDTTLYAHLFENYTPSYLARLIANPAYAKGDTTLSQTPFEKYIDLGGSVLGVSSAWAEKVALDEEVYYDNKTGELTQNQGVCVITQDRNGTERCLTLQEQMDQELASYVDYTDATGEPIENVFLEAFDPNAALPLDAPLLIQEPFVGDSADINSGGSYSAAALAAIGADKQALFKEAGRKNNLPAALLAAIATWEQGGTIPNDKSSGYRRSVCGAVGLMQITFAPPGESFPNCLWKDENGVVNKVTPADWWEGTRNAVFEQVGISDQDLANPSSPYYQKTDLVLADMDIFNIHSSAYGIRNYKMPRLNITKGSDDIWTEEEVKAVAKAYLGAYHPYVDKVWQAYDSYVDRNDPSGFFSFVSGNNDIAAAAIDYVDDKEGDKTVHYRPKSVAGYNNTYIDRNSANVVITREDIDLCYSGRIDISGKCITSDSGAPSWCVDFARRIQENATGSWSGGNFYSGTSDDTKFLYYPMSADLELQPGDTLVWVHKTSGGTIHGAILAGVNKKPDGTYLLYTVDGNYGNATVSLHLSLIREGESYVSEGTNSRLKGIWRHNPQQQ